MMPWVVKLTKRTSFVYFKSDFFPRTFHYKKDALALQAEVQEKGGEAIVSKVMKQHKFPSERK